MACTDARCVRRWSRRSRRHARRRPGLRRGWSRSRLRSTRCCAPTWTRRRSSGTPPAGSWLGWSMSMARRTCPTRRCATTSPKRCSEILAEAGKPLGDGHVPQTHPPAAEAEVDFHDLWVILRGVKTKTALFTMRLSYSARAAHRPFVTQGQEAFLEGHVHAFDRFGGIPLDKIRYRSE